MSVALTGFLTGFAKGAKERIEKEKEENEAFIANRLKTAATNRLLRQKEVEAQKQLLKDRLESVSAFLPPDATEEQKLALVSNKEIADTFVAARKDNPNLDVNKFLVVNKDKVPKNFTSVQQYLDTISASPTPVAQEQIDTIRQTQGAFGARVGANVEKMAQQYGVSAGELLAYEQPMTTPELPQFASINLETLRKPSIKDIDDRLKERQSKYLDAVEQYGEDSKEATAAKAVYNAGVVMKNTLEPDQLKWADYVGDLKLKALTDPDPKIRAAAMREYDKTVALEKRGKKDGEGEGGGKIPTANVLSNLLRNSGARAVTEQYGNQLGQNLIVEPTADGGSTFRYIGTDSAARDRVNMTAREAIRFTVQPYLDIQGRPMNRDVEVALRANGVQFDENGRAVFPSVGPRPPLPPKDNNQVDKSNPLLRP